MNENLENNIKQELESWNEIKDKVLNVIPVKEISFRTRALLSDILDRLELSRQDRQDLEKYIIYGGGENIEYIKSTIGDLLIKVPELNYLIDNIQTVIPLLNKLDELFKDVDEDLDSFKELYNTLNSLKTSINNLNTTHNNDIKNISSLLNTIKQTINNDVLLKKDSPFEKGEGENSAVLKGEYEGYSNKAISQTSIAVGAGTIAGLKGWYYGAINKINNTTINVYLSSKQVNPKWGITKVDNPSNVDLLSLLGKGTVVSFVNDSKYDNKFVINNGRAGMVQLTTIDGSQLPFANINVEENLDLEDYSIYCLTQPTLGEQNLAVGSFAEGYLTESINGSSHAEGCLTKAHGKFSHAEGRETVALYVSHAEGQDTKALGTRSHAEGFDNIANGNGSHVEGQHNVTNGQASHAEGYYTETNNVAEHAEGKYNVSNANTIHSVGIGSAEAKRKNAHEITNNGKHYIYGIGGYDGTNPDKATDLASKLSELLVEVGKKVNANNVATINGQSIINGGDIEIKSGEGSYDDTEIRNEISLRNVSAVDIDEEVEEPEDKYATKEYVNEAINSAIVVVLNTEV